MFVWMYVCRPEIVKWEKKQKNVFFMEYGMYVRPKLTFVSFFSVFLHLSLSFLLSDCFLVAWILNSFLGVQLNSANRIG